MKITLPDGSVKEYQAPVTARQIAEDIGPGLARAAVGAKVGGTLVDLDRPIDRDAEVAIVTKPRLDKQQRSKGDPDPDALYLLRHSAAHVMAEAIQRLWPDAQLAYGPPLENGFYYDIALDEPISADDFERIEAEMKKIIDEDRPFTRYELPPDKGFHKLEQEDNRYKKDNARRAVQAGSPCLSWYITGRPRQLEFPESCPGRKLVEVPGIGPVPAEWQQGNTISWHAEPVPSCTGVPKTIDPGDTELGEPKFEDLCMGPHLPSTGHIGAFKVMSVAQSHWHGDITSDKFQRVYGTAFFGEGDLETHLQRLEEARQRDHRMLGQKLGLFAIDEQVGQGLILWKPKGAMVRSILQDFLQNELLKRGYDVVYTPHIGKIDLYKTSGHFPYYQDSQFPPIQMRDSDEQYLLRPMNCPHHIKIFASDKHSYRDLPIRLAEFGTVYRFEQSGELTGMTRVRGFTQDDAHIFCTEDQVKAEFRATIELVQFVFRTFGFAEVSIRLSLRDPDKSKYSGKPETWDRAERELREVLEDMQVPFTEAAGEAAFYGPKVDFIVKDVIGRSWQLGTVQLDYNLPERFAISYVGSDNAEHRPVMIHRAPFGSMERFMAILIEHYNGAFPLWLSPEQVRVLPISDKFLGYAQRVHDQLKSAGFRAKLDSSNERLNAKIKVAQDEKVPYMLVMGGRDEEAGTVSVRHRHRGDLGAMPLEQFIEQAQTEAETHGGETVGD